MINQRMRAAMRASLSSRAQPVLVFLCPQSTTALARPLAGTTAAAGPVLFMHGPVLARPLEDTATGPACTDRARRWLEQPLRGNERHGHPERLLKKLSGLPSRPANPEKRCLPAAPHIG